MRNLKKRGGRLWVLSAIFLLSLVPRIGAEEFRYLHRRGERYRILSVVRENVYLNGRLSHRAEILNRVSVEVAEVKGETGRYEALFQSSERAFRSGPPEANQSFLWNREYQSVFDRDSLGNIGIDKEFFMPVVRNVPVFPGRHIAVGDTWSAEGHEAHDFREGFGIPEPYRIPFTADYAYLGSRSWKDREYPAFSVSYRVNHSPDPPAGARIWPRRITGASDQILYWNRDLGQERAYEESFRMIFELSDGTVVEYRGTAQAEILGSEAMNKEQIAREIERDLENRGLEHTGIRVDSRGVTLTLEAVQFASDSPELLPAEKTKLDFIGEILSRYPDRDILVAGHTALAGTREGRQELSVQRAAAVADYLIRRGIRSEDRVVVRGHGAEQPLADNGTEEGRRRNRRVEITILEN
ncbi:MAG: OmpA family protein [Treponema sp.]|jgi:outer membrane protein OmpA-like peptidoglycan-associated protein|nr:OmpA family protein [Treponema sp.]